MGAGVAAVSILSVAFLAPLFMKRDEVTPPQTQAIETLAIDNSTDSTKEIESLVRELSKKQETRNHKDTRLSALEAELNVRREVLNVQRATLQALKADLIQYSKTNRKSSHEKELFAKQVVITRKIEELREQESGLKEAIRKEKIKMLKIKQDRLTRLGKEGKSSPAPAKN